jgi:hypothetical protein
MSLSNFSENLFFIAAGFRFQRRRGSVKSGQFNRKKSSGKANIE